MRIDKFLWCVRACKTRTQAADHCKSGKIWVNGELVKASRELKAGDTVKMKKGPVHFSLIVLSFPTSRVGARLVQMYVKDVTPKEELDRLELIRLQRIEERPRGLGRPTKRDRRSLDDFFEWIDEE